MFKEKMESPEMDTESEIYPDPTAFTDEEEKEEDFFLPEEEQEDQAPVSELEDDPAPKKKKFRKKVLIPVICLALVAIVVVRMMSSGGGASAQAGSGYVTHTVATQDITQTLSGTGSLSPADSYTVTTLMEGDILSANFEEGDIVVKDTVLYQIDSSDVSTSIEQSQLSLSQSQRSYSQKVSSLDDLKVKANESGQVLTLDVEVGDDITAGQTVATIRNSATMSLEIPFGSDDAAGFYIGQSAEVTIDGSFERLSGTIRKISANEERLDGNMLVRRVTIDVSNPGGISPDQAATAMVGAVACNGSGTFSYKGESTVTTAASGTVSALHVSEGSSVSKDQLLVTLKNDTLRDDVANSSDSVRNSQLSLQNQYDKLDNYTVKSPIAGTIIEKFYKAGDKVEAGKVLCTIFDLSYLTMTLNVDELDISQVEVGQPVAITVEALPGKTYQGYVTKININGATANGVTSYPVEIRIDVTDGLLPGMNVQAEIILSSSEDVVSIPVSALARGNRVLVQIGAAAQTTAASDTGIPSGFAYQEVSTGVSDGAFIEITHGLSAGDTITYIEEAIPAAQMGFMMQNGGDMGGGAAPSGDMGGGTQIRTGGGMP